MEDTPAVKPKAKKKDPLDSFIKEFKSDKNDLRILIYLQKVTGIEYNKINMKQHELLKLLINDYANRKSPSKAKEIRAYIKTTFKSGAAPSIFSTISQNQSEDASRELFMKDIKRAFGDPEDSTSIAHKILNNIYEFPEAAYNCSYNPDLLAEKLFEYYNKKKSRTIYYRQIPMAEGQQGAMGSKGSSNWWNASLNSEISTRQISNKR